MAATTDITINNNSAIAKTFTPTVAVPGGSDYRETSSPVAAPVTLRVLHTLPTSGSSANAKFTLRFSASGLNAGGQIRTAYLDVTGSIPKDGVSDSVTSDLRAFVVNFLTDVNFRKLIMGGY